MDARLDLILHQLDDLPTLPAVAVRVLDATGRDDTAATDVVRLLESDPALSARILKLVHRSDLTARGGNAETVARAVALLGFDAVRCATLAVAVYQTLGGTSEHAAATGGGGTPFDRQAFWTHSLAVACCADLLALRLPHHEVAAPQAFLAGLLHDLGKAALDAALPKSYARVIDGVDLLRGNIADVERAVIGVDHHTAGRRLAEQWRLPDAVVDVAWLHGQPPAALAKHRNARLINLVTLADLLVREQHLGYSGNYALTDRTPLVAAVGLTASDIDAVLAALVAHMEPRATALGLGQATGDELYRSALTRANRELGHIGQQLAAKNRRLAAKSKFFDAAGLFQSQLHVDAPPADVLRAVAHTAAGVLGTTAVAAFSLVDGQAQAVLVNAAGDVLDRADLPLRTTEGKVAVLDVTHDLEPLMAVVGPRLADAGRFWTPLLADTGSCVGGVCWGAAAGEPARLEPQQAELVALAHAWALALCTAQVRDAHRQLAEQLANANRQLIAAQDEIAHARAMRAVAEMAAGAGHEMNTPLAVITGRAELLAAQLSDPAHRRSAATIVEQGHRLSAIITDLMDFARPTPPTPLPCRVAELVQTALSRAKALDPATDRTVVTTVPTTTALPRVTVDAAQAAAALAELVANAVQATDGRPVPRVTVTAAHVGSSPHVAVTVTDNGCGMDEPTARRAFDPFFSGRPAGRRRGLGLAKALRWAEAVGGSIRLDSQVGRGTTAVLLWPVADAPPTSAVADPPRRRAGSA